MCRQEYESTRYVLAFPVLLRVETGVYESAVAQHIVPIRRTRTVWLRISVGLHCQAQTLCHRSCMRPGCYCSCMRHVLLLLVHAACAAVLLFVHAGMLGEVVGPAEPLGADAARKRTLSAVRAYVSCQFV